MKDCSMGTRFRLVAALGFMLLVVANTALAGKPVLDFIKSVDLPDVGLRLRLMSNCREKPASSPTVYAYLLTRGNSSTRVEMYAPFDLWYRNQQAGEWEDKYGNTLNLATITHHLPRGFPREHTTREEYDQKLASSAREPDDWSPTELSRWVSAFTESEPVKVEVITTHPPRLTNLMRFDFVEDSDRRIAYAFRLNSSITRQYRMPENWFFILFEVARDADLALSRKTVRTKFFRYVKGTAITSPGINAPSRTFQNKRLLTTEHSPEFLAGRQRVTDSIRNMRNWWHAETEHYIILSNMRASHRETVKDLQTDVEGFRGVYAQLVPARTPISAVGVIRIFASEEEYMDYVDKGSQWTGGLWMPSTKELVIRPLDSAGSRAMRERILRIAYHEAFHQYLFYALDQLETSPWFNEGHAGLFDKVEKKNRSIRILEDPSKVFFLKEMIERDAINIPALLNMSLLQFYDYENNDETVRRDNYVLAWALVYYLRKGAPLDKHSPYASLLDKYVDALWESRHAGPATDMAFAGIDLDALQASLIKFWRSPGRRSAARRNRLFHKR